MSMHMNFIDQKDLTLEIGGTIVYLFYISIKEKDQ